jgi:hypothetical protein
MSSSAQSARVVIEALRAGVPNRAAIGLLGNAETAIEDAFTQALNAARSSQPLPGMAVAGGFGTGKSHLLGYLREVALKRNFVVSWVTVSKETPLYHLGLVFAAAMRSAVVPHSVDDAITVLLGTVQDRAGAVQSLEQWAATPGAGVAPVFAAVTHLLTRSMPPELLRGVEAFLSGAKPPTPEVRRRLAELGARGMFDLSGVKAATLHLQRPRFMTQLVQAAGYAGWCVLIDEVELIGRYGPMQRAKAYVQLAHWLGLEPKLRGPGLYACCAISDDFADVVINARQDDEKLPELLARKDLPCMVELAGAAMRAIRDAKPLHAPTDADLARHAETLRECYSTAYEWTAPAASIAARRSNLTLRHHVRSWITEWDMLRLQGSSSGVDVSPVPPDYTENPDMTDSLPEGDAPK